MAPLDGTTSNLRGGYLGIVRIYDRPLAHREISRNFVNEGPRFFTWDFVIGPAISTANSSWDNSTYSIYFNLTWDPYIDTNNQEVPSYTIVSSDGADSVNWNNSTRQGVIGLPAAIDEPKTFTLSAINESGSTVASKSHTIFFNIYFRVYPINTVPSDDPFFGTYTVYWLITYQPYPDATGYDVYSNFQGDHIAPDSLSARIYSNDSSTLRVFTVTANLPGSSFSTKQEVMPCFLAGSLVHMADGTTKAIEDVKVNDQVIGAFGEINTVLFLHRPKLGTAQMCKINNDHSTTNHHPHVSADKKFYCGDPDRVSKLTYGRVHMVFDAIGSPRFVKLHGLKKERINKLTVGTSLKTIGGSRTVNTLEVYSMPPETQLYNLVVGGSHTYHVEGYAVTGWPREDDFNYDTWSAIS
jgi:hypothetical protein